MIIEGRLADEIDYNDPEMSVYVARTYRDAPEIDGVCYINTDAQLVPGDIETVEITDADEYDLWGEICEQ